MKKINPNCLEVSFEPLNPENSEEVSEVAYLHCACPLEWNAGHEVTEVSLDRAKMQLAGQSNKINYVLLAKNDTAQIIGLHWAQFEEQEPLAYLISLWVRPDYRRRGIAKNLKANVEVWLRNQGLKEVRTQVHTLNQAMINFNSALGFSTVVIGMTKKLDTSPTDGQ